MSEISKLLGKKITEEKEIYPLLWEGFAALEGNLAWISLKDDRGAELTSSVFLYTISLMHFPVA